jgi:hypothetical protein
VGIVLCVVLKIGFEWRGKVGPSGLQKQKHANNGVLSF